jgi:hypothetical protein
MNKQGLYNPCYIPDIDGFKLWWFQHGDLLQKKYIDTSVGVGLKLRKNGLGGGLGMKKRSIVTKLSKFHDWSQHQVVLLT